MKKFVLVLLSLIVLPLFLFSGCDVSAIYTKQATGKSASDFFYSTYNAFNAFQSISNNYTQEPLFSLAQTNKLSKSWTLMDNTNKENIFALTAIDMFTNQKAFNFYDLSCLSTVENKIDDNLSNFSLFEQGSTTDKYYYYYTLSGLESSGFMPTPGIINRTQPAVSSLVDEYDFFGLSDTSEDINIALWGNYLRLTVETNNTSYTTINSDPVFAYPSAMEVPNVEVGDVKVVRNDSAKTIYVVYVGEDSNTYTKEVSFNTIDQATGKVKKIIRKYLGDKSDINATPSSIGKYEYELTTDSTSEVQITGKYEILFDKTNSYYYCKHTKGSVKVTSEFYVLASNVILTRFQEVIVSSLTSIDFVIKANASSANLKYKTIDKNGNTKLVAEETTLFETYGELTTEDKQGSNPVIAFNYSNNKIQYESVN